uniref:2-Apr n=1 Tax=Rhizophora mucronata TaxID=61149 RepID=A0A2P2K333_RHIMU
MGTCVGQTQIRTAMALVVICGRLMSSAVAVAATAAAEKPTRFPICPTESVTDIVLGFRDRHCVFFGGAVSSYFAGVTEVSGAFFFLFFFLFSCFSRFYYYLHENAFYGSILPLMYFLRFFGICS